VISALVWRIRGSIAGRHQSIPVYQRLGIARHDRAQEQVVFKI